MVTEGVGGTDRGPRDRAVLPGRFFKSIPVLFKLQGMNLWSLTRIGRGLKRLNDQLDGTQSLADLYRVNVEALAFAIPMMFALGGIISGLSKIRRALGIRRGARVVTKAMYRDYARLAIEPDRERRLRGLEDWLVRYGHRGPLESDLSRPRFAEMRDDLIRDLNEGALASLPGETKGGPGWWVRPFFLPDEVRERFRDDLMRLWSRLRAAVLEEAMRAVQAGHLDRVEDVFLLRGEDLQGAPETWRAKAESRRADFERDCQRVCPDPVMSDQLDAEEFERPSEEQTTSGDGSTLRGIGLGAVEVTGTAVRCDSVTDCLARSYPKDPILVVSTLEPSWAVTFPRFRAVVVEMGGELSHGAILLREAGIPALINVRGACSAIVEGDQIRIEPRAGMLTVFKASGTDDPDFAPETLDDRVAGRSR